MTSKLHVYDKPPSGANADWTIPQNWDAFIWDAFTGEDNRILDRYTDVLNPCLILRLQLSLLPMWFCILARKNALHKNSTGADPRKGFI
jgi:hypothetical protein